MIYETLERLQRKQPSYIYQDETDGKIKSRPLLQSAGAAYLKQSINHSKSKVNSAKEIHRFIFGH